MKKTNTRAERDFGMLDYQMKLKPKATDFAIEGVLMFKLNNADQWRDKLTEEKKKAFLGRCTSVKKATKRKIHQDKTGGFSKKSSENGRHLRREIEKEWQERVKKEQLIEEIEKVGLWKTAKEVEDKLGEVEGVGKKRAALWLQVRFIHKV